jgi:nucleotide-binding universal stress UspA family protein
MLALAGLDVSTVVRDADPRQFVVQEAAEWKADSVFVGAFGQATLDRFLFGTVVAAVAARAPCSVEVVRERL